MVAFLQPLPVADDQEYSMNIIPMMAFGAAQSRLYGYDLLRTLDESLIMFSLRIDPTWAQQIAQIRNANSDDSNLIRFDNSFYRVCRAAASAFQIRLSPSNGQARDALSLQVSGQDFYITSIDGQPMGRYASTIDSLEPSEKSLDAAVFGVKTANGDKLFLLRSLIVFCVAESIRSDQIATRIGQMIAAARGQLLGVSPQLNIKELLPQVRDWGQACDAVWVALSPEARRIFAKPASALTPAERQFSERVNDAAISGEFRSFARAIKVLKRPANR